MIKPAVVREARVNDELITVVLADGRELSIPTAWSERLSKADQGRRDRFDVEPGGLIVAWSDADEHIGVWTFLGLSEDDFFDSLPERPVTREAQPA